MADKENLKTNGKKGRDRRFLEADIDSLELRPHIGILDLEPHRPQTGGV